jgi:hypothetical protein
VPEENIGIRQARGNIELRAVAIARRDGLKGSHPVNVGVIESPGARGAPAPIIAVIDIKHRLLLGLALRRRDQHAPQQKGNYYPLHHRSPVIYWPRRGSRAGAPVQRIGEREGAEEKSGWFQLRLLLPLLQVKAEKHFFSKLRLSLLINLQSGIRMAPFSAMVKNRFQATSHKKPSGSAK